MVFVSKRPASLGLQRPALCLKNRPHLRAMALRVTARPHLQVSPLANLVRAVPKIKVLGCANHSGIESATWFFPNMTQATLITTGDFTGGFVPFVARGGPGSFTCIFVLNTPNLETDTTFTLADVHAACERVRMDGLVEVTQGNANTFIASFRTLSFARRALKRTTLSFTRLFKPTVQVRPDFHLGRPPRAFACDTSKLDLNHETLSTRIFDALSRPESWVCTLLRQQSPDRRDRTIVYLLRFSRAAPAPMV